MDVTLTVVDASGSPITPDRCDISDLYIFHITLNNVDAMTMFEITNDLSAGRSVYINQGGPHMLFFLQTLKSIFRVLK